VLPLVFDRPSCKYVQKGTSSACTSAWRSMVRILTLSCGASQTRVRLMRITLSRSTICAVWSFKSVYFKDMCSVDFSHCDSWVSCRETEWGMFLATASKWPHQTIVWSRTPSCLELGQVIWPIRAFSQTIDIWTLIFDGYQVWILPGTRSHAFLRWFALLVNSLQWNRKIQRGNSCRRMLTLFEQWYPVSVRTKL